MCVSVVWVGQPGWRGAQRHQELVLEMTQLEIWKKKKKKERIVRITVKLTEPQ